MVKKCKLTIRSIDALASTNKDYFVWDGGKGVANRSRDLLSSVLSFAVRQGYRTDNPALGVRNYKMMPRERFLTPEEYQRLGQTFDNAIRGGVNPYAIAALRILTLSGARSGEIISLQRRWIEAQVGGARLPDFAIA